MKKILKLLLILAVTLTTASVTNSAHAACYGTWSVEEEEYAMSVQTEELQISNSLIEDTIVEPMCTGYKSPMGWSGVRSTASLNNTTSSGTKIYHNSSGGFKRASADFNKVATTSTTTKYVNTDGSITFVKRPTEGDVRLYYSSSGNNPSLWWGNEKIRYLGVD
ncbi:hypothetical protein ACFPYN_13075 [Paenisporosarcina macmurdoensis]|uniref:Secreted protein n=1 Tax=Paenisporosarcina macmurdoensis TaxID=212659 RepID=A0ABW1L8N8_9BACL